MVPTLRNLRRPDRAGGLGQRGQRPREARARGEPRQRLPPLPLQAGAARGGQRRLFESFHDALDPIVDGEPDQLRRWLHALFDAKRGKALEEPELSRPTSCCR